MIGQDTWQAMEKLVDEGLVKSIGISNFSVPKTKELQSYARIKPVVNQVEIHPFWRNDKLWEYAQSSKVCHLPYLYYGTEVHHLCLEAC